MLFTGHTMLAAMTRVPELQLSVQESDEFAKALTTVSSFYNVEVAEKTMAWVNLAMVGGMIYGTRLVAMRQRRIEERAQRGPEPINAAKAPGAASEPTPTPLYEPAEVPDDWFPGMSGMGPMNGEPN
jgi:hypothetical protein